MSSTAWGYSNFYQHTALSPEIGIFRRFGAHWAKKLHDETSDLRACLAALNQELAKWEALESRTVLDCPKQFISEKCASQDPKDQKKLSILREAWSKYDEALMRYGKTLCMSEHIMNMPTQDDFNLKKLKKWSSPDFKPLMDNGVFVPTGEHAETYLEDSARNDTCTWRSPADWDFLTSCLMKGQSWIEKTNLSRRRSLVHNIEPGSPQLASTVKFENIVRAMDVLTCVLAPIFLSVTVAVLASVHSLRNRIGVLSAFGILFALLLRLMAGSPTRGEVFGSTAAFFAVAVVFVGTTTNACACSSASL